MKRFEEFDGVCNLCINAVPADQRETSADDWGYDNARSW